ncbi:hypothetical protein HaLaN_04000, partial [Haematococcus lacustris]
MAYTWHTHGHGRLPPTALPDPFDRAMHRVGMTKHALSCCCWALVGLSRSCLYPKPGYSLPLAGRAPWSGQKHSSSGRHLLSPMRCMFNAALQSLSTHLPGCGAGLRSLPDWCMRRRVNLAHRRRSLLVACSIGHQGACVCVHVPFPPRSAPTMRQPTLSSTRHGSLCMHGQHGLLHGQAPTWNNCAPCPTGACGGVSIWSIGAAAYLPKLFFFFGSKLAIVQVNDPGFAQPSDLTWLKARGLHELADFTGIGLALCAPEKYWQLPTGAERLVLLVVESVRGQLPSVSSVREQHVQLQVGTGPEHCVAASSMPKLSQLAGRWEAKEKVFRRLLGGWVVEEEVTCRQRHKAASHRNRKCDVERCADSVRRATAEIDMLLAMVHPPTGVTHAVAGFFTRVASGRDAADVA